MQSIKRYERRRGRPKKTFDEELSKCVKEKEVFDLLKKNNYHVMSNHELLDRQESRLYNASKRMNNLTDDVIDLQNSYNSFIKVVTVVYVFTLLGFGSCILYILNKVL